MAHSSSQGRERWRYYCCTGYHNKGTTVCPSGLPLSMREADAEVLTQLREHAQEGVPLCHVRRLAEREVIAARMPSRGR